jgi:galactonate dehydratase
MFIANPLRDALATQRVGAAQDLVDGRLTVPQGPGLGIDIDWDAVQRYRIDT